MRHTGMKVVAGLAVVAVGAVGFAVADRRVGDRGAPPLIGVSTGTAEIRRVDVAERRQVSGTLGYAETYSVLAAVPGLLTQLPAVGTVISRGQSTYEIDGRSVRLLYGLRPSWRPFQLGMTNGTDVEQLETNLKQLGYGAGLTVDQHFNDATRRAVRKWQQAIGLTTTGSVPLGQVVFMPAAFRVAGQDLQLGAQVQPGVQVEHGTGDQPAITVQLSPQQLPGTKVGDQVVVTLPDGRTRGGTITGIGPVTTPSGADPGSGSGGNQNQPTAPVSVRADGVVSGFLDQAQVRVAITVRSHPQVLAVPITALNAIAGGGYEVIVVDGTTTRRIPVQTGVFDEAAGLVEVSAPGLAAGQRVQVPHDRT